MRIIAGKLGGRQIQSPHDQKTHPMSEKIRGALFNTLGDITGLTVLDTFAGSGALSFEAISRGAKHATVVNIDKKADLTLKKSAEELKVTKEVKAIRANVSSWSDNNPTVEFDIILAAPPYHDLQIELLRKLTKHVKKNGLYVLDWPGKHPPPALNSLELITAKLYGDSQLVFYRKINGG
jgi:16S rRNA (guanine966-N2)-methyltransferase